MDEIEYQDGDWYQDNDSGSLFEYCLDIDANQHRWFEINPDFYIPDGRQVKPPRSSEK